MQLDIRKSASGRLWVLHPRGRPNDPVQTCRTAGYPTRAGASRHMRARERRERAAVTYPVRIIPDSLGRILSD